MEFDRKPSPAFKSNPGEILCLLSFDDEGVVQWASSIGQISDDFLKEILVVFHASLSLAAAIQKVSDDTVPPDHPCRANEARREKGREAYYVSCEERTVIMAKPSRERTGHWFGIIARPLDVPYEDTVNEILVTFEDAADIFFLNDGETENKTLLFWESVRCLLGSTRFSRDPNSVGQVCDLILTSCEKLRTDRENASYREPPRTPSSNLQTVLTELAENYLLAVNGHYQASAMKLAIFTPELTPYYSKNVNSRDAAVIAWYYASFVSVGLRAWQNTLFESDKSGTTRIWYKRNGWMLYTQFLCTTGEAKELPDSFQTPSNALLDAVSRKFP